MATSALGLLNRLKKRHDREERGGQRERYFNRCEMWEIRELKRLPLDRINFGFEEVNAHIQDVNYLYNEYPDRLQRAMNYMGVGHVSMECFVTFIMRDYLI